MRRASPNWNSTPSKRESRLWAAHGFSRTDTEPGFWFCGSALQHELLVLERLVLHSDVPEGWQIVKCTDERLVVQGESEGVLEPIIVKARRQRRKRRWPFGRRAPNEMLQQLEAARRGLRVPAVVASGELSDGKRCFWSVHVMHCLPLETMRVRFLAGPSGQAVEALLKRAGVSLLALYRACCNHIDFGPHAILMSDRSANEDVIIDFEYASFFGQPSPRILAAHIGYFGWSIATNRDWATYDQVDRWFQDLFARCNLTITPEHESEFRTNLIARQSIRQRMSRRC